VRFKSRIKTVATNVAIAFFFTAIFVLIYYYVVEGYISKYINLINVTAVKNGSMSIDDGDGSSISGEVNNSTYNIDAKRLLVYPKYGSKYATLEIKSIDLKLSVYHGDNLKILRRGVGHYAGSYFPGENGTVIFAAHNTPGFFNKLDEVKNGDKVVVKTTYASFEYEVYDSKVVKETDLSAFNIQHEKEILIMYTCYPINRSVVGRKTKRYVVYARKVGVMSE
jgi:LPXTG-site transpeptidase (sortase) family protein